MIGRHRQLLGFRSVWELHWRHRSFFVLYSLSSTSRPNIVRDMHPLSSASGSRSSLRASSASLLVFVLGNSLGVNCSFWVNVELASLISVINRVSSSAALWASTSAFGSMSSARASSASSIVFVFVGSSGVYFSFWVKVKFASFILVIDNSSTSAHRVSSSAFGG